MTDNFDAMAQEIAQSDEGEGYFEPEPEWPNCPTPDCEWKVNAWAGLGHCSPCSKRIVGPAEMQHRYNATRISATDKRWNGLVFGSAPRNAQETE